MRNILHSDLNNFYASVECLINPEMRDKPGVVEIVIWLLADSVASCMREEGLNKARTVQLYIRDSKLLGYQKQEKLPHPKNNMNDIAKFAFKLFKEIYS